MRLEPRPGEKNGMAKLTNAQAASIRKRYASGSTIYDLAAMFGVSHVTIYSIVRGKTYKEVQS